ncbi:MAG: pirin family protein [Prochlorococcaceae cyanobacterium]|jgi:redox-sensitive bicupin YhaK (pirin superfamily)
MTSSTLAAGSGLLLRPAGERFHSTTSWLESWHTFSFAGHFDPEWMGFGPLLVINDDTIAPGQGFGFHPHRDMEIVTVMVEGELHHRDSLGHTEVLRAGEVQRMSAGTGVVHSEINGGSVPCRLLQIWIEPSRRGIPPAYEQKPFAIGSQWTLLLDPGRSGEAMAIERPVRLWRARPQAGEELLLPVSEGCNAWLQMISGSLQMEAEGSPDSLLQQGDGLGFTAGRLRSLRAGAEGADVLLFELP